MSTGSRRGPCSASSGTPTATCRSPTTRATGASPWPARPSTSGASPTGSAPISGIPEIVRDGVNGLLVEPDDPCAVADAVVRLREDRELAGRISVQARATVERELDGERLAGTLQTLFREVIA